MNLQSAFQRQPQVINFIPQPPAKFGDGKVLILDSGTIINLSMNGLLYIIPELKKLTGVRFAITQQVKYEVVDRPIGVPRFELEALRVQQMIDREELELPDKFSLSKEEINSKTKELMNLANTTVKAKDKFIDIVSDAEMSCLAMSQCFTEKGIENIIGIDERTTRILAEKPENIKELMSNKLHYPVQLEKKNFRIFSQFRFIRSTELVYVAFKKNVLKVSGPKALEAALYATKYKGSSVSFEEIDAMKKL